MAALTARRAPVASTSRAPIVQVENHFQPHYPHRLNFYDKAPHFDVTLEQFESYALNRLRILAEIESSFMRNRSHDDLRTIINTQQKKYLPLNSNTAVNIDHDEERKRDHVSHFVLRLAFCRSEELRRRFIKAEGTLFKVRWETDDSKERVEWLRSRDFGWIEVSEQEKSELEPLLKACTPPAFLKNFESERYYKVPWTRVPDLVEKRRAVLRAGTAYVAGREQFSIVFQQFQADLEKALEMTARALPRLDEDRLTPILDHLAQGFTLGISSEYSSAPENGEAITADMIDDLARKHFPLCMRMLHSNLREDSHLKHQGRLQYGLFLKIIGLSIEEALAFWKQAFSKKINDEKFRKEYEYNIKHSYGLVGKMANYPARSCQTILTTFLPGTNESHGCPYRQYSEDNLRTALQKTWGMSGQDLQEVMGSVKTQHFHVACTRVFELTHGVKKGEGLGGGESVNHPNAYAQKSREMEKAKSEAVASAVRSGGDDAMNID